MSDPYNSYGSQLPPMAATATATAPVMSDTPRPTPTFDPIARLDVSDTWKRRFRKIEQAGGPGLPNFRDLSFGERFGLNFNFLAFLFGPIYFLAKGLWRQALSYFGIAIGIGLLMGLFGIETGSRAIGYGLAAVFAMRANVSYYQRVVQGEAPWV